MTEEINISADETTIDDILSRSHRFEVPNYQRQYSWTEEQWSELWDDLISIEPGESHFLGSIVVISSAYEPTGSNYLQLVDGQQRLTTISLFLCSLRNKYQELGEEKSADIIDSKYLWDEGFNETKPRISLGTLDHEDYMKILTGKPDRVSQNELLKNSYDYFSDKISEKSVDELDEIRDILLNNMSLVMIRSNSEGSAFRLFETLNDRGLDLSAIDLMKNHLLRISHDSANVGTETIKEDWEQIILNIQDLDKRIRFFRHYFMSCSNPVVEDRITESKVYSTFKSIISEVQLDDSLTLEEYISDMERNSRLYMKIARADIDSFSYINNSKINKKIRRYTCY